MYPKFFPIGSVVTLLPSTKKVMIMGRYQTNGDRAYHYCGCLYPEGYLKPDKFILFNNSDIKTVHFLGLQNEEEFLFLEKLLDVMNCEE